MRIVIATTFRPFAPGPDLAAPLRDELTARGFDTDLVRLPFDPDWSAAQEQIAAFRLLDLRESCGNRIDRLIAVHYPSFALRHPNKVAWFTPPSPGGRADSADRHHLDSLWRSDGLFLRECRGVFTTTWAAADRIRKRHRVEPLGVLYPPLPSKHPFRPGPFGDHLLCVVDRSDTLAVEAAALADPDVRVVVVGEAAAARAWVEARGPADRVTFAGPVGDERRAELLAGSCGLVRLGTADDPFGAAAVEAFHAHKPVLTVSGVGGALEQVRDGLNGLVCHPTAAAVGAGMTRLWRGRAEGEQMGQAGHATLARANIHWDVVVRGLTT